MNKSLDLAIQITYSLNGAKHLDLDAGVLELSIKILTVSI